MKNFFYLRDVLTQTPIDNNRLSLAIEKIDLGASPGLFNNWDLIDIMLQKDIDDNVKYLFRVFLSFIKKRYNEEFLVNGDDNPCSSTKPLIIKMQIEEMERYIDLINEAKQYPNLKNLYPPSPLSFPFCLSFFNPPTCSLCPIAIKEKDVPCSDPEKFPRNPWSIFLIYSWKAYTRKNKLSKRGRKNLKKAAYKAKSYIGGLPK